MHARVGMHVGCMWDACGMHVDACGCLWDACRGDAHIWSGDGEVTARVPTPKAREVLQPEQQVVGGVETG